MQTGNRRPVQEAASKPLLLGLTAAIIVGIIVPLVLPHILHPSVVYHAIIHIASIIIAAFLTLVSIMAYRRTGGTRTLFMTLGFAARGLAETFYLLQAAGLLMTMNVPTLDIDASHLILLAMLSMFGLGVLKVNK